MKKITMIIWIANILLAVNMNSYGSIEVWSAAEGRDPGIRWLGTNGTLIGNIPLSNSIKSMALVGDQIWYSADDEGGFHRLALDGTPLPNISGSWSPTSIIVVGNEVWYGSKYLIGINRCSFDGTPLPSISTQSYESSTLCKVSDTEVWSGAEGRDPGIRRIRTDGTLIGDIPLSNSIKSMALVGDQIWYGADDEGGFHRLALDGTPLPNISGSWSPTNIIVVGNEVWYGSKYLIGINRCSFDGTPLPSISTQSYESSTLLLVPEPATILFFTIGFIFTRKRNSFFLHKYI
jgi:hypothetical protein